MLRVKRYEGLKEGRTQRGRTNPQLVDTSFSVFAKRINNWNKNFVYDDLIMMNPVKLKKSN